MTSRLLVDKIESKSGSQIDMSAHTLKMPSGHVVQTVTSISTTQTNITTNGSFTNVTSSEVEITSKLANSSFLYMATMSAECDASSNFNVYFQMRYKINGGSSIIHPSAQNRILNGTAGLDSMGTVNQTINYLYDNITSSAGTTFVFFFQHRNNTSSSFQYNQQSLGGQPSGKSNASSIIVQEIAQ